MDALTLKKLPKSLRKDCEAVCRLVQEAGGQAYLVGGCVRDMLLGITPKDADIEVFGLEAAALEEALGKKFKINNVGRSFGVLKLSKTAVDVSLPRSETKTGTGHKGFETVADPFLPPKQAAARRDFTVNALMWNPLNGSENSENKANGSGNLKGLENKAAAQAYVEAANGLLDFYGGVEDLKAGVLRHVGPAFAEDPLRVLRAMQFAARFGFSVHPSTVQLCKNLTPEGLPPERLFEEWRKLIVKGKQPSLGLSFLKDCGWVQYYPELAALIGCAQDAQWHPEGDVWNHTLLCLDAFARERLHDGGAFKNGLFPKLKPSPTTKTGEGKTEAGAKNNKPLTGKAARAQRIQYLKEDTIVGFAVLCHDMGKPQTSFTCPEGRIRSPKHDAVGVEVSETFLRRFTQEKALIEAVLPLVLCHMHPLDLYRNKAGDGAIRRLAKRVGRIDRLVRVDSADRQGRGEFYTEPSPQGQWLLQRAEALQVKDAAPKPLVQGRHLVQLGHKPGPAFKKHLNACYEAQLEGTFTNEAGGIAFLKTLL